jgi:hypothetical protein
MMRRPALHAVTFVDAALNCIIRLEREGDELAQLLAAADRLAADLPDPAWQIWRLELAAVRGRQAESSDRW